MYIYIYIYIWDYGAGYVHVGPTLYQHGNPLICGEQELWAQITCSKRKKTEKILFEKGPV